MLSSFFFFFLIILFALLSLPSSPSSSFIQAACTIPDGDYSSCDFTSTSTFCQCTPLTDTECFQKYFQSQNPVPSLMVLSRNRCEVPQTCDPSSQRLNTQSNVCELINTVVQGTNTAPNNSPPPSPGTNTNNNNNANLTCGEHGTLIFSSVSNQYSCRCDEGWSTDPQFIDALLDASKRRYCTKNVTDLASKRSSADASFQESFANVFSSPQGVVVMVLLMIAIPLLGLVGYFCVYKRCFRKEEDDDNNQEDNEEEECQEKAEEISRKKKTTPQKTTSSSESKQQQQQQTSSKKKNNVSSASKSTPSKQRQQISLDTNSTIKKNASSTAKKQQRNVVVVNKSDRSHHYVVSVPGIDDNNNDAEECSSSASEEYTTASSVLRHHQHQAYNFSHPGTPNTMRTLNLALSSNNNNNYLGTPDRSMNGIRIQNNYNHRHLAPSTNSPTFQQRRTYNNNNNNEYDHNYEDDDSANSEDDESLVDSSTDDEQDYHHHQSHHQRHNISLMQMQMQQQHQASPTPLSRTASPRNRPQQQQQQQSSSSPRMTASGRTSPRSSSSSQVVDEYVNSQVRQQFGGGSGERQRRSQGSVQGTPSNRELFPPVVHSRRTSSVSSRR